MRTINPTVNQLMGCRNISKLTIRGMNYAAGAFACFCWMMRAPMPTSKKKPVTIRITVIQLAGFQPMIAEFSIDFDPFGTAIQLTEY